MPVLNQSPTHLKMSHPSMQVDDLAIRLRRMYEPGVSPDGTIWMMQKPFTIDVRRQRGLPTEIWLETEVYHFTEYTILYAYPDFDVNAPTSEYLDGEMPAHLISPRRRFQMFHRSMPCAEVLLGNASSKVSISGL